MTKLQFSGSNDQLHDFLQTFIRRECTGELHDAMTATNKLIERWGMRVDWHFFAYALDAEMRCGWATITRPGGFTQYVINSKPELS